ncbi:MAG: hypothetical protein M1376_07535 [Planctomycetes bacterium]|nr:hypothetical protein [Planctomycetota bacterium]
MCTRIGLWVLAVGWLLSVPCLAQGDPNVAKENAKLRQRVETLEKQVQQMQTTLKPPTAEQPPVPTPPPAAEQTPVPTPPAESAKLEPAKKPLWSTLDIQLYGYIKLDAAWDSSGVFPGDYVLYTREGREGDDEFNITAKQTRLGAKISGPEGDNMKASGVIEFDFYGAAGAENKANVLLRHAYMVFDWPDDKFSILAGQASDVISPLLPSTLNYTVLWDAGNIGYRHPQVRLTQQFQVHDDMTLELAGAISRTISGLEVLTPVPFTPGADAGFPTFQGRAGLTFPWFGFKPTTVGVSAHWGQEKYSSDNKVDSWSLNLDALQPITPVVAVKGELYVGQDLGDYFGGIGQGVSRVNATRPYHAVGDWGGWFAVALSPWDAWSFNVGAGLDDVDNDDVNADARTFNRSVFANAIYALNKSADIGVELSQWRTDFKNADDVDDFRIQTSFIYKF